MKKVVTFYGITDCILLFWKSLWAAKCCSMQNYITWRVLACM